MGAVTSLLSKSTDIIQNALDSHAQTIIFASSDYGVLDLTSDHLKNVLSAEIFEIIPDETNSIKIEQARAIINSSVNTHTKNRYFIIHHADSMNIAAQNSLLKILEEPNSRNYFFLLSDNYKQLLSTVISRSRIIRLPKTSRELIKKNLNASLKKYTKEEISQIEFIAQDNFQLWQKMIDDKNYFDSQIKVARLAKQIISSNSLYDRIVLVKEVGKDRQMADRLAEIIIRIHKTIIKKNLSSQSINQLDNWSNVRDSLAMNSSVQLTLTLAVI